MSTAVTKKSDNSVRELDRYDWGFPTIFGRNAWGDVFGDFFSDFDKFFGKDQVVPCDVIQHKDNKGVLTSTEIQYALAGYNKDNVSIEINGNTLSLVVEKTDKKEDADGKEYVHKGISHRRIEASYNLNGYDKDNIQASFENGVLSLKIPVLAKSDTKRIEIK